MKILVTGKVGQVVSSIVEIAKSKDDIEIITLGRPEINLENADSLLEPILKVKPDIIISAAAYTAVDKAENEQEAAFAINGLAPGALGEIANKLNIPILHLSTDYVYSGDKDQQYEETDQTSPISIYGKSKLDGEINIAKATDNYVILRTAWVYSPYGNNFVKTMLRLGETRDEINVVGDQYGSPTSALEIASALIKIASRILEDDNPNLRGIFHLTSQGGASWAQFATTIFNLSEDKLGKSVHVKSITTAEYPTLAKRPANSRLSSKKLTNLYNITLPEWEISLKECLDLL